MVSLLPLLLVNVNTDFNRYVPLARPLFVVDKRIELSSTCLLQLAPFTSVHIHKLQCFCKVCVTVILTAFSPVTELMQYAVPFTMFNFEYGELAISYKTEIP